MTGAEHYREAERLIAEIAPPGAGTRYGPNATELDMQADRNQLAAAQVHATLALFDHVREIGDQLDAGGLRNRMAQL